MKTRDKLLSELYKIISQNKQNLENLESIKTINMVIIDSSTKKTLIDCKTYYKEIGIDGSKLVKSALPSLKKGPNYNKDGLSIDVAIIDFQNYKKWVEIQSINPSEAPQPPNSLVQNEIIIGPPPIEIESNLPNQTQNSFSERNAVIDLSLTHLNEEQTSHPPVVSELWRLKNLDALYGTNEMLEFAEAIELENPQKVASLAFNGMLASRQRNFEEDYSKKTLICTGLTTDPDLSKKDLEHFNPKTEEITEEQKTQIKQDKFKALLVDTLNFIEVHKNKKTHPHKLIIIFRIGGNHFSAALIKFTKDQIFLYYLNTLKDDRYLKLDDLIINTIKNVFVQISESNTHVRVANIQEDGKSCGPLMLEALRLWTKDKDDDVYDQGFNLHLLNCAKNPGEMRKKQAKFVISQLLINDADAPIYLSRQQEAYLKHHYPHMLKNIEGHYELTEENNEQELTDKEMADIALTIMNKLVQIEVETKNKFNQEIAQLERDLLSIMPNSTPTLFSADNNFAASPTLKKKVPQSKQYFPKKTYTIFQGIFSEGKEVPPNTMPNEDFRLNKAQQDLYFNLVDLINLLVEKEDPNFYRLKMICKGIDITHIETEYKIDLEKFVKNKANQNLRKRLLHVFLSQLSTVLQDIPFLANHLKTSLEILVKQLNISGGKRNLLQEFRELFIALKEINPKEAAIIGKVFINDFMPYYTNNTDSSRKEKNKILQQETKLRESFKEDIFWQILVTIKESLDIFAPEKKEVNKLAYISKYKASEEGHQSNFEEKQDRSPGEINSNTFFAKDPQKTLEVTTTATNDDILDDILELTKKQSGQH